MFRSYIYILVSLALIGWVVYQLVIRKKAFSEILNEVLFILFFIMVWAAIYYWALH
jgi:hypothetical protein